MLVLKKLSGKYKPAEITTAEAFCRLYRALPKRDRFEVARYILEDRDIQHSFEIPNETTLKSFAEDKSVMLEFHSVEELRKDLLS